MLGESWCERVESEQKWQEGRCSGILHCGVAILGKVKAVHSNPEMGCANRTGRISRLEKSVLCVWQAVPGRRARLPCRAARPGRHQQGPHDSYGDHSMLS